MNNLRVLAVDPSGTGTTGVYYWNGKQGNFHQYQDKDWREHYWFIRSLIEKYYPDILLYETTNFISLRGKDMTSLLKLLGTVEIITLPYLALRTETIPVDQVKRLKSKLLKGEAQITGLEYKKGIGWHHNRKKISTHELDAYLVYWLWQTKLGENKAKTTPKTKLVSKTISKPKSKAELKQNLREND